MKNIIAFIACLACGICSSDADAGLFRSRGGSCAGGNCASGNCGANSGFTYAPQFPFPAAKPVSESALDCSFMGIMGDVAVPAGLLEANYPGAHVCESTPQEYLMRLAQAHADVMARTQTQGHQNWDTRFRYINQAGLGTGSEICAESWEWQRNDSPTELWREMFKSWSQSPGHWRTASARHRWYGAGMAQGRNGTWYACIIASNP